MKEITLCLNIVLMILNICIILSVFKLKIQRTNLKNYDLFNVIIIYMFAMTIRRILTCINVFYNIIHHIAIANNLAINIIDGSLVFVLIYFLFKFTTSLELVIDSPSSYSSKLLNESLKNEIRIRQSSQEELERQNKKLRLFAERLEHMLRTEMWVHDKREALRQLDAMLQITGDTSEPSP